ncbi:pentatricopeptide repeat-containing protein At4g17616 [Rutidosis leptorrhynchoides]|uniref:pentatricopeptide repeat-containing protein At4g17616 n=1 Tax=Rutidosis leptorrhynchoides TaxID=125765 RepID=UPI003A99DFD3
MAWSLVRTTLFDRFLICSSSSLIHLAPNQIHLDTRRFCWSEFVGYNSIRVLVSASKKPMNFHLRYFCNNPTPRSLSWGGSYHEILLKNLESYIQNHQINEAWETYMDYKKLYGLPDIHLLSMFIAEFSYTREPKLLQRACDVIQSLPKKKSNLLQFDLLYNVSLSLARTQMPVPASTILRIMIEKDNVPPVNLLGPLILHMVKTEIGTYLASNILIQICDHFQHKAFNRSTIKPNITIFNLILDSCSRYNYLFKAQQIIELMAQIGVVGDAYTIITIARIHAYNGQRDELKKFKHCVDQVAGSLGHHYFQFYDCLMSLHFKFNDFDAACKLISDMSTFSGTCKGPHKPFVISLGSQNLRKGLKLQVLPHVLQENFLMKLERNEGLVMHINRKLVFSNKTIAKLIVGYKREGRISDLVKLLCQIQIRDLISDVINACIHVGWLETAHDIIEDIEREGNSLEFESYASLLSAYYKGNKHREAEALLKQIKKAGIIIPDKMKILEDEPVLSEKSNLITCLVQEMKEKDTNCSIYEFNSSIYFFMKAEMIDDALKAYESMQRMKVYPNATTYIYMVMGYSSLDMYREITHLWGDIWRSFDEGNLSVNRDLYEVLILNFLKGGYFERVMEVIGCMKKNGMYVDIGLYKSEFLKLHKDLYVKLKASDARTETQSKRLEHVKAFRKLTGID